MSTAEIVLIVITTIGLLLSAMALVCGGIVLAREKRRNQTAQDLEDKQWQRLQQTLSQEVQQKIEGNNALLLSSISLHNQTVDEHWQTTARRIDDMAGKQQQQGQATQERLTAIGASLEQKQALQRGELMQSVSSLRQEMLVSQQQSLQNTDKKLESVRQEMREQLQQMRKENAASLDEMRQVVDQKLHASLETSLTRSFSAITTQLQEVYKSLGEMQALSQGVNDLRRTLSGVKTRGIWGEVSLGGLLEEILAPEQYVRDFRPRPGGRNVVEFAVKMPGRDRDSVYLPIDSKFPLDTYQHLVDAAKEADAGAVEMYTKELVQRIKSEARDIRDKYINVPVTTDFALLYLPVEGLYAEVCRDPALLECLQRDYRVLAAGPTTLAALLNSLQVGFRTLAIEKRSTEVWRLLSKIKAHVLTYQKQLARAQTQLGTVGRTLEEASKKGEQITTQLRDVEVYNDQGLPTADDQTQAIAADEVEDEGE